MKKYPFGFLILLTAAFFYASFGIFAKIIGTAFAPFYLAGTRSAVTLLFFAAAAFFYGSFIRIEKKDTRWFLLLGIFGSLAIAPLFYAFVYLPLGTVLFISYAATVITGYMAGGFLFKEKIKGVALFALLCAFAGLWLVYRNDILFSQFFPAAAAFSSGAFFSIYFLASKKISGRYSSLQINTVLSTFAVMINGALSFVLGESANTHFFSFEWLAVIGYAAAAFIGFQLTIAGFKYTEAHRGSVILLAEVPFGLLFGLLFFKETISAAALAGGVLILLATALPDIIIAKHK